MRPTAASAPALGWPASAQKHGAAVEGLPCPSYLLADAFGGILVQGIEARPEGTQLGDRRDNQD